MTREPSYLRLSIEDKVTCLRCLETKRPYAFHMCRVCKECLVEKERKKIWRQVSDWKRQTRLAARPNLSHIRNLKTSKAIMKLAWEMAYRFYPEAEDPLGCLLDDFTCRIKNSESEKTLLSGIKMIMHMVAVAEVERVGEAVEEAGANLKRWNKPTLIGEIRELVRTGYLVLDDLNPVR